MTGCLPGDHLSASPAPSAPSIHRLVMRPFKRIISGMTRVLEMAFQEAAKLSPEEQDEIGSWLLSELADERAWHRRFRESQDALSELADEALGEIARSDTTDLDPTRL
jgi:hypothetical protein